MKQYQRQTSNTEKEEKEKRDNIARQTKSGSQFWLNDQTVRPYIYKT